MNTQTKTTPTPAKAIKSGDRVLSFAGDILTIKNISIGDIPGRVTLHTIHGEASAVHPDFSVDVVVS